MEQDLLPKRKRMEEDQSLLQSILDGAADPTDLPLALLKDITNDFSEERKIGQGGSGAVYKGVLGELIVAVKRIYVNLDKIDDDDKKFGREFNSLCNTNHRNIVRFLGFCSNTCKKLVEKAGSMLLADMRERLFCFEYISSGSLDKHITDELRGFEWETRFEIIIGICKGLRYLHEEKNIIHMDLKPANILLHHQGNKYTVPKITDFGLSRPNENSHTVGLCFGTLGYMAPEYREGRKTTPACDIYSLGAIIRELVTGCMEAPNTDNVLRRWRHRWNKPPTQLRYQQVTRCIYIARCCRGKNPEARPSTSEIMSYLSEFETTHGQISPCLDEDDMLEIKPLELRLPSELKNQISRSIELINGTLNSIAFYIELSSDKYIAQPEKGIVQPKSERGVNIIVQPGDSDNTHKFIVKSMKVSQDLRDEVITKGMFKEDDKVFDKVDLMVVHEIAKPQEKCKIREETNMSAEVFLQSKKRKIVESTSGKGQTKLGSSENGEATSVDTYSSVRGQCNLHPPLSFSRHYPTNMTYLGEESHRAVDVTRGAMGSLLDKLGKLITEDYGLDMEIKANIEYFSVDLASMLRDLPKLKNVKEAKIWVDGVRELAYNIEDMVDNFLVNVEPNSSCGFREVMHESVKLVQNGMTTHRMICDVIRDIKADVKIMSKRKKKYNIDVNNVVANATTKVAIDPRILVIYEHKEQLIGIKAPRDDLVRLLQEDGDASKQNLKIISIVGMGGLGKTTLAKTVHEELQDYHPKAFVPVGQNPDVKTVLKKIIVDCQPQGYSAKKLKYFKYLKTLDMEQLIKELKQFLEDKRYFIVIDDIWDSSSWRIINSAFPRNDRGSRVITTTRIQRVADHEHWKVENIVYKIKALSYEDSRNLFFRRTFGPRKHCPDTPRKEEISKYILEKCAGMPLAINSIASYLACDESDSFWEHARKSFSAIKGDDVEKMKQILDLSYIYLPDHLKSCLLHVCMYPEDREINKNDLLRQWVAEGFVSKDKGQDAEDVAEEYFKALIDLFMIQPGKIDYTNEVLSCRVHDIILEIMRSKSSKENFIHVIDGLKDVSGQIRRVSVQCNDKEDSTILETMKGSLEHARSVLLYRPSLLPDFLKYKHVRVLHLEHEGRQHLDLTGISSLPLLGYLKIACYPHHTVFSLKLPGQIGQLQQLETIDLEGYVLKNYPSDIIMLPWLSHLRYNSRVQDIMPPNGIERLKSLRTLVGVCLSQSSVETIKGLGEMTNLRNLEISLFWKRKSNEEIDVRMNALHSSISRLSISLRILDLRTGLSLGHDMSLWNRTLFPEGSHIRKLHLRGFSFQRCPEWIGQLHHLYSLCIRVREVAGGVSIVEGLPSLTYFEFSTDLEEETKQESVVISGGGAFQALKELHFECVKTSLTFEEGALPKLEKFKTMCHLHTYRSFVSAVGIEHLPAPTLAKIGLSVLVADGDWYDQPKVEQVLERAIKEHHPGAHIYIVFKRDKYREFETSEDEEDSCSEEEDEAVDYSSEEDDEGAYQVNGSQTSAQVQPNTRHVELSEDCGRMSTNTDAHPTIGASCSWIGGPQSGHTQDLESLQLPFPSGLPSCLELTQPRLELPGEVQDVESSQLPCTNLPSSLQLTQPRLELPGKVQDVESLQLPCTNLPSSLELTQPRLELPGEVQDVESSQLPCTNLSSSLQLTQPISELNQAPNEINTDEELSWMDKLIVDFDEWFFSSWV